MLPLTRGMAGEFCRKEQECEGEDEGRGWAEGEGQAGQSTIIQVKVINQPSWVVSDSWVVLIDFLIGCFQIWAPSMFGSQTQFETERRIDKFVLICSLLT